MTLQQRIRQLLNYLSRDVWLLNLSEGEMGKWHRRVAWMSRMLYLSVLRFQFARCGIRASQLTTVTIISVVPVLAFAFAIAKGLGAYQKLQNEVILPGLDSWLIADQAPELRQAVDQIFLFVEDTDLSNLGMIGLLTVAYAVIRLLGSVEDAFNDLWGIKSARSITRKIADYLSVTVIVPLILFCRHNRSDIFEVGVIFAVGSESVILPTVLTALSFPLVWAGFMVAYRFIPNTKVFPEIGVVGWCCRRYSVVYFSRATPSTSVWCRQLQCHLCWVFSLSYFHALGLLFLGSGFGWGFICCCCVYLRPISKKDHSRKYELP